MEYFKNGHTLNMSLNINDSSFRSFDFIWRFDRLQDGMDLVDMLAEELGLPRHALDEER